MARRVPGYSDEELIERERLMHQMQFLGQMASTETALFHQTVAAKCGLGITDIKTVSTLQQEGAMTASSIAKRLNLTTGAVTNVVDRLEGHGLVKRTADDNDRRKVVIVLQSGQLGNIGRFYRSMGAAFEKALQKYTTKELEFLVDFHETTVEMTKSEISKLNSS